MRDPISSHRAAGFFTPAEDALITRLLDAGQAHLFTAWPPLGGADTEKRAMLARLARCDASIPGGLVSYLQRARVLLAEARAGGRPYAGYLPNVPDKVVLTALGPEHREAERRGLAAARGLAVVLVAGGLGERLGYHGIKLDIPPEITTGRSYLELYARTLRAIADRAGRAVPLVIMTSGQTHDGTRRSLEDNGYFGLDPELVWMLQQELVPALADDQAHIALDGSLRILLKPHGHGDVHALLHASGVARRLAERGCTHLLFIQDTNGQVVNTMLPALGVAVERRWAFGTVTIPRVPGEAVGALVRLRKGDRELTINVEYNQLDALLRAAGKAGDVADETGYSPYPGNTNTLVVEMARYLTVLERTGGVIAEFANPKYADAERTRFSTPTRLETMMQDLPKLFTRGERVGITVMETQIAFSPGKNKLSAAQSKAAQGQPARNATAAESDLYAVARRKLAAVGVQVEPSEETRFAGVPFASGARVVIDPSFALTLGELSERFRGGFLGREAHLVLEGTGLDVEDLQLRGRSALVLRAGPGVTLRVRGLHLDGEGMALVPLTEAELDSEETPDHLKIRGYRRVDHGCIRIEIDTPGTWEVGPDAVPRRQG